MSSDVRFNIHDCRWYIGEKMVHEIDVLAHISKLRAQLKEAEGEANRVCRWRRTSSGFTRGGEMSECNHNWIGDVCTECGVQYSVYTERRMKELSAANVRLQEELHAIAFVFWTNGVVPVGTTIQEELLRVIHNYASRAESAERRHWEVQGRLDEVWKQKCSLSVERDSLVEERGEIERRLAAEKSAHDTTRRLWKADKEQLTTIRAELEAATTRSEQLGSKLVDMEKWGQDNLDFAKQRGQELERAREWIGHALAALQSLPQRCAWPRRGRRDALWHIRDELIERGKAAAQLKKDGEK